MPDLGLEPETHLGKTKAKRALVPLAGHESPDLPADLAEIIVAWDKLEPAIRSALLAAVRASVTPKR